MRENNVSVSSLALWNHNIALAPIDAGIVYPIDDASKVDLDHRQAFDAPTNVSDEEDFEEAHVYLYEMELDVDCKEFANKDTKHYFLDVDLDDPNIDMIRGMDRDNIEDDHFHHKI